MRVVSTVMTQRPNICHHCGKPADPKIKKGATGQECNHKYPGSFFLNLPLNNELVSQVLTRAVIFSGIWEGIFHLNDFECN